MSKAEKLVAAYKEMNRLMKIDLANGHIWRYSNNSAKRAHNFPQARAQGKYYINCSDGAHWGCKYIGIPGKALSWFGAKGGGIAWCASTAEKEAKKYFTFIKIGGTKTVKQLVNSGTLQPGDMITYMSMNHTNAYLGNNQSFDTGHAYCSGSGEEAVFKKFVGSLVCKSYKVGYIIRLIDDEPEPVTIGYWVQCGAFKTIPAARQRATRLSKLGFAVAWMNDSEYYRVCCGKYKYLENAQKKVAALKKAGYDAIIKEL